MELHDTFSSRRSRRSTCSSPSRPSICRGSSWT